jgi:hypothetical protein
MIVLHWHEGHAAMKEHLPLCPTIGNTVDLPIELKTLP